MSEPTREHVDSVRALLIECGADSLHGWRCAYPDRYGPCDCTTELATDVLTSTDPAVLDAMQDALVRAGRLTEETATRPLWKECADPSHHHGGLVVEPAGPGRSHIAAWATTRRYVTEWTEAPDA